MSTVKKTQSDAKASSHVSSQSKSTITDETEGRIETIKVLHTSIKEALHGGNEDQNLPDWNMPTRNKKSFCLPAPQIT